MKKTRLQVSASSLTSLLLMALPFFALADEPKEDNSKVVPVEKPIKLVRSYKLDEMVHYDVKMKMTIAGAEILIATGNKITAKELKKDGTFMLVEDPDIMKITAGGKESKAPGSKPWKEFRDSRAILKDYIVDDDPSAITSPNGLKLVASVSEIILPEKEVKSGEFWETELDNPTRPDKKFKIKTMFLGSEKIDGVDYMKLDQNVEVAFEIESSKLKYHLIAWVDTTNGQMFKVKGDLKGLPTQSGGLNWLIDMQRSKPK